MPHLRHGYGKRFQFIAWSMLCVGPIDVEDYNLPTTHHKFLSIKVKYQKYHQEHRHCTNYAYLLTYLTGIFKTENLWFISLMISQLYLFSSNAKLVIISSISTKNFHQRKRVCTFNFLSKKVFCCNSIRTLIPRSNHY